MLLLIIITIVARQNSSECEGVALVPQGIPNSAGDSKFLFQGPPFWVYFPPFSPSSDQRHCDWLIEHDWRTIHQSLGGRAKDKGFHWKARQAATNGTLCEVRRRLKKNGVFGTFYTALTVLGSRSDFEDFSWWVTCSLELCDNSKSRNGGMSLRLAIPPWDGVEVLIAGGMIYFHYFRHYFSL